eukprot:1161365-Pelagomonas_calceolata.AAC.7
MAVYGHEAVAAATLNVELMAAHMAVLHSVMDDLREQMFACMYGHEAVAAEGRAWQSMVTRLSLR